MMPRDPKATAGQQDYRKSSPNGKRAKTIAKPPKMKLEEKLRFKCLNILRRDLQNWGKV
jgi:hypothetical protein